ncbi:unnamed protein product [Amoebophrya sp. A25]|nr:unnamed protein product [Amoebophrya sp. A25]|eukprot:GSA25T00026359001.1
MWAARSCSRIGRTSSERLRPMHRHFTTRTTARFRAATASSTGNGGHHHDEQSGAHANASGSTAAVVGASAVLGGALIYNINEVSSSRDKQIMDPKSRLTIPNYKNIMFKSGAASSSNLVMCQEEPLSRESTTSTSSRTISIGSEVDDEHASNSNPLDETSSTSDFCAGNTSSEALPVTAEAAEGIPSSVRTRTMQQKNSQMDKKLSRGVDGKHEWEASQEHHKELTRSFLNEKPDKAQKDKNDFMIIAGNGNPRLARKVAKHLGVELSPVMLTHFNDGESRIHIKQSCRGKDIFIIQPTCPPVNENLVDLLLMISTCRRASAKRITAVVPYYGYARADRKNSSRVPIAAADVAELITAMGADRVVSVDLHNGAIQGFFPPNIPLDNLSAMSLGVEYFSKEKKVDQDCVVISPDAGGVYRARQFQERLIKMGQSNASLALITKQRSKPGEIDRMDLIGTVRDKDVIIVDDLVDTAGTLCEAARHLKLAGAKRIFAFITHGVLSGNALERIRSSNLEELVVTDSIPGDDGRFKVENIKIISLAVLVADGVRRIYQKESLSWETIEQFI